VPGNIYYIVLPAFYGLEATAHFKALMNLLMPILQFNTAIGGLFVPAFVRAKAKGTLLPSAFKALVIQVVPAVSYWIVLFLAGAPLIDWLYGGRYESAGLIWLGVIGVASAIIGPFDVILRAIEHPEVVALIYAAVALLAFLTGLTSVYLAGLHGAIIAGASVYSISALLFVILGIYFGRKANE
jgi:O-antigen/teichoic acid export membrane protein